MRKQKESMPVFREMPTEQLKRYRLLLQNTKSRQACQYISDHRAMPEPHMEQPAIRSVIDFTLYGKNETKGAGVWPCHIHVYPFAERADKAYDKFIYVKAGAQEDAENKAKQEALEFAEMILKSEARRLTGLADMLGSMLKNG